MATNGDILLIIEQNDNDCNVATDIIIRTLGIDITTRSALLRKVKRIWTERPKKARDSSQFRNWSVLPFSKSNKENEDPKTTQRGRPRKRLSDSVHKKTVRNKIAM